MTAMDALEILEYIYFVPNVATIKDFGNINDLGFDIFYGFGSYCFNAGFSR